MIKFIRQLFDDDNSINEKAVVGFIAFCMLCLTLIVNLISTYFGNPLVVNEFIFDGFMVIILGAFGIASVDKWMNKKHKKDTSNKTNE